MTIATLVALPAIYETARFNQMSFLVLALVLAAVTALEQRQPVRAGVWLGLATVLKLLPVVFALWLVLKRQWAALGALTATALVVALLPCLLVFGPQETASYHRQWWDYNLHGAAGRGMVDPGLRAHFIDHRNQSITAVVARLCWPEHPHGLPIQPLELSARACWHVSMGLAALLALGLIWATRRPVFPSRSAQAPRAALLNHRAEAAAYLLAMLVFSPLVRTYYLVWALPGLVLLTASALDERERRLQRLGQIGLAVWVIGMLAWMSDTARACGVHLLMLVLLGGILLRLARAAERYSRRKIRLAL